MIENSTNKELDPDAFYAFAEKVITNPFVSAFYGIDVNGMIREVVIASFDTRDSCIYLENFFNVNFERTGLLDLLNEVKSQVSAKAIKLLRPEVISTGG